MKKNFIELIKEALNAVKKVYVEPETGQYVETTIHSGKDRIDRQWWDSWKDESFTKFVGKGLRRLNSLYKEKIKDPNYPIDFRYQEEMGILNKDKSKGMIISLRDTGGNKFTSFAIVTVLNANAVDAKSDKVFVKVKSDKHLITLNESTQEEKEYFYITID